MNSAWSPLDMLRALLPGVGVVQDQIAPYAQAWARDNAAAWTGTGPLWVAMGDSLSQGIGASAYDLGWVGQARTKLALLGREYRVLNLSASGATTAHLLVEQLPVLAELTIEASLVTVLIGGNDVLRADARHLLPERMRRILDQLPDHSLVARMPQPLPVARKVNSFIDADASIVPVDVRRAAARFHGHRAPDLFHPNDRGYAGVASAFVDAALTVSYP